LDGLPVDGPVDEIMISRLFARALSKSRRFRRGLNGAGCRNRTRDIQFTKLALYQLS
jgi:hypothetical protein